MSFFFFFFFFFFDLLIIYWTAYRDAYNKKLGSCFTKKSQLRMHIFTTPSELKMANEIKRSLPRDLGT